MSGTYKLNDEQEELLKTALEIRLRDLSLMLSQLEIAARSEHWGAAARHQIPGIEHDIEEIECLLIVFTDYSHEAPLA